MKVCKMRRRHIIGHGPSSTVEALLLVRRHLVTPLRKVTIASSLASWSERILLLPWHHLATIRSMMWRCVPANVTLGIARPSVIWIMSWVMNTSIPVLRSLAAHCRHVLGGRHNVRLSVVRVALALAWNAVLARGIARWCSATALTRGRRVNKFRGGRGRVVGVDIVVVVLVMRVTLLVALVVLLVGEDILSRVVDRNPPSFSIRQPNKAGKGQLCGM